MEEKKKLLKEHIENFDFEFIPYDIIILFSPKTTYLGSFTV